MANPDTTAEVMAHRDRRYCAELAGAEPLWGTADRVDVWVCLEYKTAWKARALEDNALAQGTRQWLASTLAGIEAAGLKPRPQFIRQPMLDSDETRLIVAHAGRAFQFSGAGYGFLAELDLAELIGDAEALSRHGTELTSPHYLVCTNGQRDLCCARFGRPTYTALTDRLGERVWQVTHLGGHRFAPNVLTLPDGVLYGRVHADLVDQFLGETEAGRLDFARLRGRSCHPPIVQAAEAALALPGLRLPDVDGDEQRATVSFESDAGQQSIAMARSTEPLTVLKSCADEADASVYPFVTS